MLSLLFTERPSKLVSIGSLTLDATVRELHEYSNTITENPIEDGSAINDHIYKNPVRLRIEGEVTNSPISFFLDSLVGVEDRRVEAFERLIALSDRKETVTVVTGLKVYTNLVISELLFPKEVTTGKRLIVQITLKEVVRVSSQIVNIPTQNVAEAQRDIVEGEVNTGKQPTPSVSEENEPRVGSFLSDLLL